MSAPVGSLDDAALQHLHDALRATPAQRWQWLGQALAFGAATARARAEKGLTTLGPHGEVMWSPQHEVEWNAARGKSD